MGRSEFHEEGLGKCTDTQAAADKVRSGLWGLRSWVWLLKVRWLKKDWCLILLCVPSIGGWLSI